jgi:hypothetical protein
MQRFSYDFASGCRRFPNKRSRPSYLCVVSLNLLEELLAFLLAAFGGEV